MNFSYKRLLILCVIIAFALIALRWIESAKGEHTDLTAPQLNENQQNWLVQNQQEVLSRQEKLEPAR